jgi:quercetin dioxygenase-like cupin family protein
MPAEPNVTALFVFAPPQSTHADAAVIFENEHALLQRTVVPASEWDGQVGEAEVASLSANKDADDTDIALIYVTLKSDQPLTPDNPPERQHYPYIPLELVFENDRLMLQRARIEPGVFEGVHGHPGNQVFVHIKGGTWSAIEDGRPTGPEIVRKPGESGWMGEVDQHEYGNVGDTTIDLVWITLK